MDTERIELRSTTEQDAEFLWLLYVAHREQEMSAWGWGDEERQQFLQMQHHAREKHYAALSGLRDSIITLGDEPIGRLATWSDATERRIVDFALLPSYQRHGIGSAVLQRVLAESITYGQCVSLSVRNDSPARRLYARLGFQQLTDDGVTTHMVAYSDLATASQIQEG